MRKMIVAVDFDGCVTTGEYGSSLSLQQYAKQALTEMKNMDIDLILWSCRGETDGSLDDAKEFLKANDMLHLFSKFNDGSDFSTWGNNRKVLADVYLDDKVVGGWCGWEDALEWVRKEQKRLKDKYGSVEINRAQVVTGMCMTWDHSYGLRITEDEKKNNPVYCGYTLKDAERLYNQMDSIFHHNIKPILDLAGVKCT